MIYLDSNVFLYAILYEENSFPQVHQSKQIRNPEGEFSGLFTIITHNWFSRRPFYHDSRTHPHLSRS
jgi:hypothetical protein